MKAMVQGEKNKALGLLCCYKVLTLSGKVVVLFGSGCGLVVNAYRKH